MTDESTARVSAGSALLQSLRSLASSPFSGASNPSRAQNGKRGKSPRGVNDKRGSYVSPCGGKPVPWCQYCLSDHRVRSTQCGRSRNVNLNRMVGSRPLEDPFGGGQCEGGSYLGRESSPERAPLYSYGGTFWYRVKSCIYIYHPQMLG
jgi:hypothetical protein